MKAWYLCPYDTVHIAGRIGRRCAMHRYVPTVPNPDGAVWDEAEILGNHCVVKLDAPPAIHAAVAADADFTAIPVDQPRIDPATMTALRTVLVGLGYTLTEITDTGRVATQLLALLTSAVSDVRERADGQAFEWTAARRIAPKTIAEVEAHLPG